MVIPNMACKYGTERWNIIIKHLKTLQLPPRPLRPGCPRLRLQPPGLWVVSSAFFHVSLFSLRYVHIYCCPNSFFIFWFRPRHLVTHRRWSI